MAVLTGTKLVRHVGRGLMLLAFAATLLGVGTPVTENQNAWAADDDDHAPQILTSDLSQLEDTQTPSRTVTFTIVGSAPIERVTINGKPVPIVYGDTVVIMQTFDFSQRTTLITVRAEDNEGNFRERNFVVNNAGAPPGRQWSVHANAELRYEVDENPTNDSGLAFDVPFQTPSGVIPAKQRPDNRSTAAGSVIATYGGGSFFAGGLRQQYEKQVNQGLNASLVYGGAGLRFRVNDTTDYLINYIFGDLGIGDADYAELHTLSNAFEFRSRDSNYDRRHLLELDATYKDFTSKTQTPGTVGLLKWDYLRTHPASLSTFNSVVQGGNATEGVLLTDYNFLSGDWDWHNRWMAGFRWDIGFGYQVREFPNDKHPITPDLGPERLDNLLRLSTGIGWQWNPYWSAMLNYRHLSDVSNKEPYYRNIYGLTILGGF